jgi:hypothetical protein
MLTALMSVFKTTAQMHSSTQSALCSSSVTISRYSAITTCSLLRATHWLAVTTVHLSASLKCCLLHFWILLLSFSQHWLPLTKSFCPFLRGSVWHTITLEVRGFMGRHTTSGCWPLLQYFMGFRAIELLQSVCLIQYCSGGSCLLSPLPLVFIIYALIRWVKIVRMHGNKDSLMSFWVWKMLETCWNLFGTVFIDFSLWHRWGVLYTFLVQIL